ncbi:histidinol-phosphate transaminase [Thermosyntropha sp.]|uniref:histidinol-phosphate transaminase n=1 Tax=Thermosyntropha sp. TaxID=2740820 RepID=UPI0025DF247A|nr:histidinol-phosphate transaminase [Thermosyntropha sp.]MBO8158468.1 histidinol-phosphate transaminase [Thermosyntropha sp.]
MRDFVNSKARPEIFNLKPYVPGKPIEEVKRELGIEDIIKMASNENPLGASPLAVEAIKKSLDRLHYYPDSNNFYLKQKLARVNDISEDAIIIGNGSDELLKLLAETFLSPGDEVIFGDPSFVEYEFTATIMGAKCINVPLKDFRHDLRAMLDEITDKTKIIYICNPNNPTGTYSTRAEIEEFMRKIPSDVLVVFDEAYFEYVDAKDYISGIDYVKEGRNAVVLRTFSKIYGLAGLRVGYGFTNPEIAKAVERVTEPFNVNLLAQIAAEAALDDIEHVKKSCRLNREGKNYLYSQFEEMGLKYVPTEANFIFVDTGRNSREVFQKLLQLGVIVRTGDIFGFPSFIRVTIGTEEENKRFINALKEVLGE